MCLDFDDPKQMCISLDTSKSQLEKNIFKQLVEKADQLGI